MSNSRRSFIKYASLAAAGNIAGLHPFGTMNAMAQTTNDYKALVCVFLLGGNDANNMLVPFDKAGYASYANARGPLAIAQNQLLQLGSAPDFALHPNLPDIQTLFNNKTAALIANVGTLTQPTTREQYLAGSIAPSNLFSHADQQAEWQNAARSKTTQTGWAGRIADTLQTSRNPNAQIPMITSLAGDTLFCNGANSSPVSLSPGSLGSYSCSESGAQCAAQQESAQALLSFDSGLSLVQADNGIARNGYSYAKALADVFQSVSPLQTAFPAGQLAAQLKQIAQIMQVRSSLGVSRQIFFAGVGSFDTHANQLDQQAALLASTGPALAAFYQATQEMQIENGVTTFTMSDFSRAFRPNSNTGTDHAWGSHHIVLGGAVQGGAMYGKFPTLALGGPDDSGNDGRWVPTTSSVQYAATLAKWFGVNPAQLSSIFPTIANFTSSDMGFLG